MKRSPRIRRLARTLTPFAVLSAVWAAAGAGLSQML